MDALEALAILALSAVLSAVAFRRGLLTKDGAAAAFVSACIIGLCGSIWWLLAYLVFPAVAFAATMIDIGKKEEKGLQEGKKGERSALNILGVGLAPAAIALVNLTDSTFGGGDTADLLACAFISAVAVSMADTVSSEIGVLDDKVWMITTMKRTEPGINGGISRLGLLSSLIAVCGMIGNLLDSVVGAVLENKGLISKYGNNCVTAFAGGAVGFLIYFAAA